MLFESAMYQHKSENCAINYPNVIFDFHTVTSVGGNRSKSSSRGRRDSATRTDSRVGGGHRKPVRLKQDRKKNFFFRQNNCCLPFLPVLNLVFFRRGGKMLRRGRGLTFWVIRQRGLIYALPMSHNCLSCLSYRARRCPYITRTRRN